MKILSLILLIVFANVAYAHDSANSIQQAKNKLDENTGDLKLKLELLTEVLDDVSYEIRTSRNLDLLSRQTTYITQKDLRLINSNIKTLKNSLDNFIEKTNYLEGEFEKSQCFKQARIVHSSVDKKMSSENKPMSPTKTKLSSVSQSEQILSDNQKERVARAKAHCTETQINQIIGEYKQLSNLFTTMLASKYPFADAVNSQQISPITLKNFIARYPGRISGMANRMRILSWLKPEYLKAYEFILKLDESIEFLNDTISVSTVPGKFGIELSVDFNIQPTFETHAKYLTSWQLIIGKQIAEYPGNSVPLFWLAGDQTQLTLNVASNSPKTFEAIAGNTLDTQLTYEEKRTWSLIAFIQKHRSDVLNIRKPSPESIQLNFKTHSTLRPVNKNDSEESSVFMGITFFKYNPLYSEKYAIKFPDEFPTYPPKVK